MIGDGDEINLSVTCGLNDRGRIIFLAVNVQIDLEPPVAGRATANETF